MSALTDKELQVVALMAQGLKPGEIQQRLCISRKAYSKRRDGILNKYGASNDLQIGMELARRTRIQGRA